jgi:hypothetical protein
MSIWKMILETLGALAMRLPILLGAALHREYLNLLCVTDLQHLGL